MLKYYIGAAVIAALVILVMLINRYVFRRAFWSDRSKATDHYKGIEDGTRFPDAEVCRKLIDAMLTLSTERVEIRSRDGLKLVGYYLHHTDGAPLEIFFHGFRSCWQRDFCGITETARSLGHNVLFVDHRAHGESEGEVISYGVNESLDAAEWVKYATERFGADVRIILVGVSMGGATVLSCADMPLPTVKAIIADSPFSCARDIIVKVGSAGKAAAEPFVSFAARLSARLHGFSITKRSPRLALKSARVPVLIMHGTEDSLVPFAMAEELAAAGENIRLEGFPGADHVGSFLSDRPRYERIYREFLSELELV